MITEDAMPEDFYGTVPETCPRCLRRDVYPVWQPELQGYLCFSCSERRAQAALQAY